MHAAARDGEKRSATRRGETETEREGQMRRRGNARYKAVKTVF